MLSNFKSQVRAKEENQRSRDMNSALAAFVEGKSASADWWHRNSRSLNENDVTTEPADASVTETRGPRIKTPNSRLPSMSGNYFEPPSQQAITDELGRRPLLNSQTSRNDRRLSESLGASKPALVHSAASADTQSSISPVPSPLAAEDTQGSGLSSKIRHTAARAAGLIQKGVGADGVLFLDATVGSFGGLIDSAQGLSQTESETDSSRMTDARLKQAQLHHSIEDGFAFAKDSSEPARHSVVLGSAYPADVEAGVKSAIEQAKISEKVLKSLLRRYPKGEIWLFNEPGDASDEDDAYLSEIEGAGSATSEPELEQNKTPTRKRASRRARARKRDGRAIQAIFPGIRSLLFLGMWDPHQERWFGASIAVSYSSMRIFSAQQELSYIAAFCDVVLAEVWRLEAQELSRSKNDFISSISHELRSPLGAGSQPAVILDIVETC